jgi:YD repeat-containing protein
MTSEGNGNFYNYGYSYNGAARLTGVTSTLTNANNPATLASAMHYNAFGRLTSSTLGNGETESNSYDKRLRWQSYTASLNSTALYSFSVTSFAPNGDVLAANDSVNGNWTYTYDPFNRLVGANQNSGQAVYNYVHDRFGNRWQQNGPHTMLLTFTGNNTTNNNRMDGYSYDAAGNLLSDLSHTYTYDAENRIVSVDSGNTASYIYDAEGNRGVKTVSASATTSWSEPAGTMQFLYDLSGRIISQESPNGGTF